MRPRLPALAAAFVIAAPAATLAADTGAQPQESWTGQSAAEQRAAPTASPDAETVFDPVETATPPSSGTEARSMPADDLDDEVEEVNEATEAYKERMAEASPRLGDPQLADLVGRDVYSADGRQVGELSDVIAGGDGQPQVALVNGDGFLTIDGGQMQVPVEDLTVQGDRLVVPLPYAEVAERMGKEGPFD